MVFIVGMQYNKFFSCQVFLFAISSTLPNMNSSWKLSIILIVALAVLAIFLNLPAGQQFIKSATNLPRVVTKNLQPEKPKPVRIVFVGDIMFDRGVETSVQNNFGGDYSQLFTAASWIGDADITFANLEGPVSDLGNDVGSKYSFRMNPVILPVLKNLGIDVVSFANNHVGDWNIIGFTDTLKRLQDTGIVAIGAGQNKTDASRVKIIEKNGMKIGFLGFSDVGPDWIKATEKNAGILIASDPNRLQIIHDAKSQVDFLVVSYHWGTEYQPFTERQKDLAESSIDAGADLVIGHHPHVIQDYEEYKNKLI